MDYLCDIFISYLDSVGILLKLKMLHDAIEEPFCLNGSIKNLKHLKNLSVSQKVICGEIRFFRL